MNEFAILAFVVTPALVVVVGYVAVRLHEASGARQARAGAIPIERDPKRS